MGILMADIRTLERDFISRHLIVRSFGKEFITNDAVFRTTLSRTIFGNAIQKTLMSIAAPVPIAPSRLRSPTYCRSKQADCLNSQS